MKKKIRKRTVAKKNIVLPKESFLTMKKYQPQIMALKAETKEEFEKRVKTSSFTTLLEMYENYIVLAMDLSHKRNNGWDQDEANMKIVHQEHALQELIWGRRTLIQNEIKTLHDRVLVELDSIRDRKWSFDEKLPEAIQTLLNYGL